MKMIVAEIFNMCLKESFLPDCWKVSFLVPVFKNARESLVNNNFKIIVLLIASRNVAICLISSMVLSLLNQKGIPHCITQLITILLLTGMAFVIILEMLHGK